MVFLVHCWRRILPVWEEGDLVELVIEDGESSAMRILR